MDLSKLTNNTISGASDSPPAKTLTWTQSIIAACALFELNINEDELTRMAEKASLPYGDAYPQETDTLRREWFGFVHAGIIYALLGKAPRRAIIGYIGKTKELLAKFAGYDDTASNAFIDSTLNPYVELLANNEQRKTPQRLLSKVAGERFMDTLSKDQIAFISGMMAITLCNILDTLERYTFLPDTQETEKKAD